MEMITNEPYENKQLNQRATKDADQVEIQAIRFGKSIFDAGIYDEIVADALDDFSYNDSRSAPSVWQKRDLELDTAVGKVIEEISRRIRLLGSLYPFEFDNNKISYSGSHNKFYEFCLITSLHTSLNIDFNDHSRLFERISTELIKEYLGKNANAVHVGFPRDEGKTFKAAMEYVNILTGEWNWMPAEGLPEDPSDVKDEGIDFIAWIPTPDKQRGHLFILGQCACGGNWESKFGDIDIPTIRKWFNPMTLTDPIKAFTTPHHVTTPLLIDAIMKAGQFFDRTRLTILADNIEFDNQFKDGVNSIIDSLYN